jgi:SAM-dependent methyltransferase
LVLLIHRLGSENSSKRKGAGVNANRELWEKGDFTRIAATMRGSGEALVDGLGIERGMDVLDLGCGDGTTAIPAAERGADVLGVDIAANLVAAAQARAGAAGLGNARFQQGDASDLSDLGDEEFDLTLSVFGAMFAPRPGDVAREMVRVTRPGGRVVMANWIPGDPTLVAQILKIAAAYAPPPPDGFISPMTWGDEGEVVSRFAAAGIDAAQIGFERATWTFDHPGPPEELVGLFREYYGPTMNAFAAAAADGREAMLQAELDALFAAQNRAEDGGTEIAATFLLVNVNRPLPAQGQATR